MTDNKIIARSKLPREIWVLVVASFVIALGFGIVAPALPQFARGFGVGVTAATAVISAFALMRLIFAPASGRFVQHFGERPVYLIGLIIVAISTGACGFAVSYWQLLVFRGLGGIGSTMFSVSALGLLIRISPREQRGTVAGLYATSFLLGTVCGPLVGGALVQFGLRVPFFIYAALLIVAAAVVYLTLGDHAGEVLEKETASMTLSDALQSSTYRAALVSNLANGWAILGVRTALVPLFVVEMLGQKPATAAITLAVFAVGNAVALPFAGRVSDRYGRKPFVVSGLILSGGAMAVMGVSESLTVFLVLSAISGIGSGVMTPPQQAAIADVVGSGARGGTVLSTFQMTSDFGGVVGPLVAGVLVQSFSYGLAFAVAGGVLLVGALWWVCSPEE